MDVTDSSPHPEKILTLSPAAPRANPIDAVHRSSPHPHSTSRSGSSSLATRESSGEKSRTNLQNVLADSTDVFFTIQTQCIQLYVDQYGAFLVGLRRRVCLPQKKSLMTPKTPVTSVAMHDRISNKSQRGFGRRRGSVFANRR